MPRIKRWFHVSHDINSDEEVWELTDEYGVWGLRVWLQLLSIADRNEGTVKGNLDLIAKSMSRLWGSNSKRYSSEWRTNRARMMIEWMSNRHWINIGSDSIVICNWLIYNPSRDSKKSPPNPPILSEPPYPKNAPQAVAPSADFEKTKKKELNPAIKEIADEIFNSDRRRFMRLIVWIKEKEKHDYPAEVIAQALRDFWAADRKSQIAEWWPYVERILTKLYGRWNEEQAAKVKAQDKKFIQSLTLGLARKFQA